jgi:hypothetical protein
MSGRHVMQSAERGEKLERTENARSDSFVGWLLDESASETTNLGCHPRDFFLLRIERSWNRGGESARIVRRRGSDGREIAATRDPTASRHAISGPQGARQLSDQADGPLPEHWVDRFSPPPENRPSHASRYAVARRKDNPRAIAVRTRVSGPWSETPGPLTLTRGRSAWPPTNVPDRTTHPPTHSPLSKTGP